MSTDKSALYKKDHWLLNLHNSSCVHIHTKLQAECTEATIEWQWQYWEDGTGWLVPLRQFFFQAFYAACLPKGFLDFRFTDTSSASSRTKFMYSSNPWASGWIRLVIFNKSTSKQRNNVGNSRHLRWFSLLFEGQVARTAISESFVDSAKTWKSGSGGKGQSQSR